MEKPSTKEGPPENIQKIIKKIPITEDSVASLLRNAACEIDYKSPVNAEYYLGQLERIIEKKDLKVLVKWIGMNKKTSSYSDMEEKIHSLNLP